MLKHVDCFTVESSASTKIASAVTKSGVKILSLKKEGKNTVIHTNFKHRPVIIALLNQLCYNYKLVSYGFMKSVKDFAARKGLAAGLLAAMLFFMLTPLYTLRIEVKGDYPKDEVLSALESLGISAGGRAKVDCSLLEESLLKLDGVASASVEKKGTTLIVNILSELPEQDVYIYGGTGPLVATADAVVSRQIVYSGTALHKKGQTIRAGESVIADYVLVGEEKVPATARGEVYGLVYYTATAWFTPEVIELRESGNTFKVTSTEFLGAASAKKDAPYENYYTESRTYVTGILLPVRVTETTYYELVETRVTYTFEECEKQLKASALEAASAKLPLAASLKNKWITVKPAGNGFVVEATVEAEIRIDGRL